MNADTQESHDNARAARPLDGVRVVNTRARDQAAKLTHLLAERGADVIELPLIRIAPPEDTRPLQRAAARLADYDWVTLTSVNAVEALWDALAGQGMGAANFAGVKVAAVGAATARRLRELGVEPALVPEQYVAEALLPALREAADLERLRFLLPHGDLARSFLPDALRDAGAAVDDIVAYRTVPDDSSAARMVDLFEGDGADCVTFTSSSTVENFAAMLGAARLQKLAGHVVFASIGPITTQTMKDRSLPVTIEAQPHDVPGLVSAIEAHFRRR